jgi:hypothetical protein
LNDCAEIKGKYAFITVQVMSHRWASFQTNSRNPPDAMDNIEKVGNVHSDSDRRASFHSVSYMQ